MVIKKVFEKNCDDEVHNDFLKFGRGDFGNRYLIEGKKQKVGWTIKTSAEFANFFVKKCLEKFGGRLDVKGIIVTTLNLGNDEEIGFEIKKRGNFQGIKKLEIETNVEVSKILNLMEKYPRVFFALSFKNEEFELKIKAKAPKSGKPGKKNEEPKADFCSLKTNDENLVRELFFDVGVGWKECRIKHTIKIQDIIYPKDMGGMKPEEVREQSKRKGVVVREIKIDGRKMVREEGFES